MFSQQMVVRHGEACILLPKVNANTRARSDCIQIVLFLWPCYQQGGNSMKKVAIIMGSDSDLPVLKPAFEQLRKLEIPFEAHVYSAHRTPVEAANFARSARENGFGVMICAAGKAAHLAGAFAAQTTLPVIGIPVKSSTLDGLDALLSTVQMPAGMPVATVAIDGSANAALLAAQILAVEDAALAEKLNAQRKAQHDAVIAKDAALVIE